MEYLIKRSILGFVTITSTAFASNNHDYKDLSTQLKIQEAKVSKINATINSLDSRLNKNNEIFLKNVKIAELIDKKIQVLENDLKSNDSFLKDKLAQLKKMVYQIYINKLDDEQDFETLIRNDLLKSSINEKKALMEELIEKNRILLTEINDLKGRYSSYKDHENSLILLMDELENKKRDLSLQYLNEIEAKEALERTVNQVKIASVLKNDSKLKPSIEMQLGAFLAPVKNYVKMDPSAKGVTFKFKGQSELVSAGDGVVAYAGTLSNYGNVVVIDHGSDIRSVLFGEFNPSVEKGAQVQVGQLLGRVVKESETLNSVYFEIRKKNIAQNTLLWLDKNKLAQKI